MAQLDPNPPVKGQTYEAWYEGGVVGVYTNDGDTYLFEAEVRRGSTNGTLLDAGFAVKGRWAQCNDGWDKATVEYVGLS